MIVENNTLKIERLQEKDIELVRQWRNSDDIRNRMIYKEIITSEMQKKWFENINNFNNFYFIVHYKNKKVALSNIKNIDWEERSGEVGLFVVDKKIRGSMLPVFAPLSMSDFVFDILKLKKLLARIRKDNVKAIKFNKIFGYEIVPGSEDKESVYYVLTEEKFRRNTKKLMTLLKTAGYSNKGLTIVMEPVDFETDFGEKMIKLLDNSDIIFDVSKQTGNIVYKKV